ncbi:MAG TPA: anaerobic ribonucleoside-triphosphate reductase [archaeon]|jgi:ribonucleoside-triphosphate reductase|nr:anaerobic ribonucleoside-triphosphate reductase [archaeon]HPV66062.1 anaerobic ribonucleoside-triphosphate reductase [archaeon]HRS42299.1 anaerobic ribonucleoside-triphosphate reductase [Candidatus Diapherotrites archaeon]
METGLESKRQKCEVYSRVVGFVRRVDAWNYGKQAEFKDRKLFKVEENNC